MSHAHPDRSQLTRGILAGAIAGALWGLVFVVPALVDGFTPMQIAMGRYLCYGLIATLLVAPSLRRLLPLLSGRDWLALVGLSLLGNIVYYVLLANAVQRGSVAIASLVVGFLPVTVTVIGSRRRGAVPLRRLLPSIVLATAGIGCVASLSLASDAGAVGHVSVGGFACAVGALACWTAYAVLNRGWLERLPAVSAHDWNLLTGLVTGALALLLAWPAFAGIFDQGHAAADLWRLLGVCAAMALFASIIANALWNQAGRLLPLTLVGQMILFETLFALLYGFVWEARWPLALEWLAMALVVASVLASVAAHQPARKRGGASAGGCQPG